MRRLRLSILTVPGRFARLAGIAALMALAFGAGSVVSALGEPAPDTYSACVSATNNRIPRSLSSTLGNGSLYNVTVNGTPDCHSGDSLITWNAQGPAGITGATGATGPRGASGPEGPAGQTGVAGAMGPSGPTGPTGIAGALGDVGPTGATGIAGAVGATGQTGAIGQTGATGPTGAEGQTGAQGPAGTSGANGSSGPAGPAGATGQTGAEGPSGPAGTTGQTGAEGPSGPAGTTGQTGTAGASGATGPKGDTGPAGASNVAVALFNVSPGTSSCTRVAGATFMNCTYVDVGEYVITITAPGVGPNPMIMLTDTSNYPVAMSYYNISSKEDGSFSATIANDGGTDTVLFTVMAVSSGSSTP